MGRVREGGEGAVEGQLGFLKDASYRGKRLPWGWQAAGPEDGEQPAL